jgi:tRNA threonylcarbamoyladenosine biosynthesis protein TsaB
MSVLAFDTATSATAVALLGPDAVVREAYDDPGEGARPNHTSMLLVLAHRLLAEAGMEFSEVTRLAVGIGPGTFTGLRIGIATARALALGGGTELVGICSLRAMALGVGEGERPVLAVIDARRGEAFVAAYAGSAELVAPCVVAPDRLGVLVREAEIAGALAVGGGAVRFRSELEAAAVCVAPEDSPLHRVSTPAMCRLAAADDVDAYGAVAPLYLRLADAELALRARMS